jgi:HK97 family phage portal protein
MWVEHMGIKWPVGRGNTSGQTVNENTALTLPAVFGGMAVIGQDMAGLPMQVFERLPNGEMERRQGHPLETIYNIQANANMSSFVFRESDQAKAIGWGNSYSEIIRDNNLDVVELLPIHPSRVEVKLDSGGAKIYIVTQANGKTVTLQDADVLQVPELSYDGLVGISAVKSLTQNLGLSMGAQEYGASFFGNGTRPSGVAQFASAFSDEAYKRLKKSINEQNSGSENVGNIMILEEGGEWKPTSIPPNEAQFIETRQFQVIDWCRVLRLAPHFLQDLTHATFANIEQLSKEHATYCLQPRAIRLEKEIDRKLFKPSERGKLFIRHNFEGLLRGDIKTRGEAYNLAIGGGWMNRDDVRAKENMPPVPGGAGKAFTVPANFMNLDKIIEPEPEPEPTPPPVMIPVPEPEEDDEPEADPQRFKPLFDSVSARVEARTRKEIERSDKKLAKSGDQEAHDRWLATFIVSHETYLMEQFEPVVRAYAPDSADTNVLLLRGIVNRMCRALPGEQPTAGELTETILESLSA